MASTVKSWLGLKTGKHVDLVSTRLADDDRPTDARDPKPSTDDERDDPTGPAGTSE